MRALADDRELQRIPFLVSETGTLAGARRDTGEALRAIDALQGAIWSGVREALGREDADQVADAAERVALVAECVRVAALRGASGWVGALEEEIALAVRTGSALSLLLVEVEDAERVLAVEGSGLWRFGDAARSGTPR